MAIDQNIKEGNFTVDFFFSGKFDARVDAGEDVLEDLCRVGGVGI